MSDEAQEVCTFVSLKGARERLCHASAHVPDDCLAELLRAVHLIDQVGATVVPSLWLDSPEART